VKLERFCIVKFCHCCFLLLTVNGVLLTIRQFRKTGMGLLCLPSAVYEVHVVFLPLTNAT
jgi:hypothetical protein